MHFLYFWRAFADAVHFVAVGPRDGVAAPGDLSSELDSLRDAVLLVAESHAELRVSASALVDAVHATAASSAFPRFWSTVLECVDVSYFLNGLLLNCHKSDIFRHRSNFLTWMSWMSRLRYFLYCLYFIF